MFPNFFQYKKTKMNSYHKIEKVIFSLFKKNSQLLESVLLQKLQSSVNESVSNAIQSYFTYNRSLFVRRVIENRTWIFLSPLGLKKMNEDTLVKDEVAYSEDANVDDMLIHPDDAPDADDLLSTDSQEDLLKARGINIQDPVTPDTKNPFKKNKKSTFSIKDYEKNTKSKSSKEEMKDSEEDSDKMDVIDMNVQNSIDHDSEEFHMDI